MCLSFRNSSLGILKSISPRTEQAAVFYKGGQRRTHNSVILALPTACYLTTTICQWIDCVLQPFAPLSEAFMSMLTH